jgi:multidrug efflux pump subunit AcrA (membrane-fusion protein)
LIVWLTLALSLGIASLGLAGQGYSTAVYEGRITSVKIDKCGLLPGLCEGSILLTRSGGEVARVDVRIGTWIKRGDTFLTIEDLKTGDLVKAQTFRLPDEANPRAAILEFTSP